MVGFQAPTFLLQFSNNISVTVVFNLLRVWICRDVLLIVREWRCRKVVMPSWFFFFPVPILPRMDISNLVESILQSWVFFLCICFECWTIWGGMSSFFGPVLLLKFQVSDGSSKLLSFFSASSSCMQNNGWFCWAFGFRMFEPCWVVLKNKLVTFLQDGAAS